MKSKLGKEIISKILTERRRDRVFYKEYEEKRGLKEEAIQLEQKIDSLDTQCDTLSDDISKEKETIPEDVSLQQQYGEFVIIQNKKKVL